MFVICRAITGAQWLKQKGARPQLIYQNNRRLNNWVIDNLIISLLTYEGSTIEEVGRAPCSVDLFLFLDERIMKGRVRNKVRKCPGMPIEGGGPYFVLP